MEEIFQIFENNYAKVEDITDKEHTGMQYNREVQFLKLKSKNPASLSEPRKDCPMLNGHPASHLLAANFPNQTFHCLLGDGIHSQ